MSGQNLQILPVLDTEVLQEKAQAAAMKGAISTIEDFYNKYDSPFKKMIEEELKKQEFGYFLQLPDILSLINESLSKQIDQIANAAVAKTYVPLVNQFLTRVEKDVKFSEVLKRFVKLFEYDDKGPYDFSCEVNEREYPYEWLDVTLSCEDQEFKFTLHKDKVKDGEPQTHSLLSLPFGHKDHYDSRDKMILSLDGAKLELPFVRDILSNDFVSFCARLILCDSNIHMDTRDFEDWMFPERCHCH
jgi:hypothetical protein